MDLPIESNSWKNLLEDKNIVSLDEYLETYSSRIVQDSERLFVREFLYPILWWELIKYVIPQYPFLDSSWKSRRIDFVVINEWVKIALEVNWETYHSEWIIPNENFDDNLFRQNEILWAWYKLLRFSYNQLQSPQWRPIVFNSLKKMLYENVPYFHKINEIRPTPLQNEVLDQLNIYRSMWRKKWVVVLPTWTWKTILSALDTKNTQWKILFIVHRLEILEQAFNAFKKVYENETFGILTWEIQENVNSARILFASKDSLRNPSILNSFSKDEFSYIIIDEVHHGQAPSYLSILHYFDPTFFMLWLTATPDRMDRKDILELFEYNKVFELPLVEAIDTWYLVPFNYYWLKDNIDYSNIRYNWSKYNVQDLDRTLIINERNEAILSEYLSKWWWNKWIWFCCSIKHAEKMAEFFNEKWVPSKAITSNSEDREQLIKDFRDNKINVIFTVDLFNEWVDIPNVQVLMFLRPTESKTIFLQQLWRGLRLCTWKAWVTVLDFISNYKKANNIRKYLSKWAHEVNNSRWAFVKYEYEYSPSCNVVFDSEVERILDAQDMSDRQVTKDDLVSAYYDLAETLSRKPSQEDIKENWKYKLSYYINEFWSWTKFLKEIWEFTEASYHFPQWLHLWHLLYILKNIREWAENSTHLKEKYIRLRWNFSSWDEWTFQRQTKYKLQWLMELWLIRDERDMLMTDEYKLELTDKWIWLYENLKELINRVDLSFKDKWLDHPSWEMVQDTSYFNTQIRDYIKDKPFLKEIYEIFISMDAIQLILKYLYKVERKETISKSSIYENFFKYSEVFEYCDQRWIDTASDEWAKHRCPFLLNVLEMLWIIDNNRSDIQILTFFIFPELLRFDRSESNNVIIERYSSIKNYILNSSWELSENDIIWLREIFWGEFLTESFFMNNFTFIDA